MKMFTEWNPPESMGLKGAAKQRRPKSPIRSTQPGGPPGGGTPLQAQPSGLAGEGGFKAVLDGEGNGRIPGLVKTLVIEALGWWMAGMDEELMGRVVALPERHGARRVEVFGSRARGEAGPESDPDLIVEFEEEKSLLELVGVEQEMKDRLDVEVDLLTRQSISPHLAERIGRESRVIYG